MNNYADNIKAMKRLIFKVILFFCAAGVFSVWLRPAGFSSAGLFAAPLEGGFAQAPRSSASPEEKARVFSEARINVINAALKYENTPYRHGGITNSGLDCSGFIYASFKDALGVSLPRSSAGLYTWAEKIPFEKAQAGDLLFFKTDTSGRITHVALYLGDDRFIHSASAGPKTGVIYSTFEDRYWSRTFAGAGRAFPEASSGFRPVVASAPGSSDKTVAKAEAGSGASPSWGRGDLPSGNPVSGNPTSSGSGRLLLGVAIAPTWNAFLKGGDIVRGFASQLRIGAETYTFGPKMVFGLEIRPEYDGALGVFRLPITFSWGPNDQIMIFAGPVFSFGEPSLSTEGGERHYSGGTNWLGAIGFTAAPFIFETKAGEFAPYLETAWQYYFNNSKSQNINADFSAGFRFSTGLRWTIQAN